uniref:Uncharacterized protein n=2 Tax=Spongospora subterranea TaxID=70186 RepID=A0A0H5QHV4_9EUKA|eukprot:CRZ01558.1 hypothetical protein [Spongospora subterranea]
MFLVWNHVGYVSSRNIRQQFAIAHVETSQRFFAMDSSLDSALTPEPFFVAANHNESWLNAVERYTRYTVEVEVIKDLENASNSKILRRYRRIECWEQPRNTNLETCLSRLPSEIERILSLKYTGPNSSTQTDLFVCNLFCVAICLLTSNIGAESLISRGFHDELQQIRFALDQVFKNPLICNQLSPVHIRLLLAALIVLRAGLQISRPIYRLTFPTQTILSQLHGINAKTTASIGSAELGLVIRAVDYTPSVPDFVDPIIVTLLEYQRSCFSGTQVACIKRYPSDSQSTGG